MPKRNPGVEHQNRKRGLGLLGGQIAREVIDVDLHLLVDSVQQSARVFGHLDPGHAAVGLVARPDNESLGPERFNQTRGESGCDVQPFRHFLATSLTRSAPVSLP